MKPKLLYVATHVPVPWLTGIMFQEYQDLLLLARSHDIHLVAMDNDNLLGNPAASSSLERLRSLCAEVKIFARPRASRTYVLWRRMIGVLQGLPSGMAYNVRSDCVRYVKEQLRNDPYMDVYLSNFFIANISRKWTLRGTVGVRLGNIESTFMREVYLTQRGFQQRVLAFLDWRLTEIAERRIFRYLRPGDAIITATRADTNIVQKIWHPKARVTYLPLCPPFVDAPAASSPRHPVNPDPVVVFTGTLDNELNLSGIEWFIQHVWPSVRHRVPYARLVVAGRRPGNRIMQFHGRDGVLVVGNPSSMEPILRNAWVCIAPIFFGAGVKQKCLEAFVYGVPLVTTSKGAEGLEANAGRDYICADSDQAFADAVSLLLVNPALAKDIGENGARYVNSEHGEGFRARIFTEVFPSH